MFLKNNLCIFISVTCGIKNAVVQDGGCEHGDVGGTI
jgi:hypothetical protein